MLSQRQKSLIYSFARSLRSQNSSEHSPFAIRQLGVLASRTLSHRLMANPAVSARTIFSTGEKDDDWEKEKKKG
jgi:hypothetical protein